MKKVLILNGIARSGKDTFVDFIEQYSKFDVTRLSTIDEVKYKCSIMFGTDIDDKSDANRRLWSDIKDAWTRYNDGIFKDIVAHIDKTGDNHISTVICREPNEIAKFKKYYGSDCITILIERDVGYIPNNHADENVNDYDYDYLVVNNKTLDHLKNTTCKLLRQEGL